MLCGHSVLRSSPICAKGPQLGHRHHGLRGTTETHDTRARTRVSILGSNHDGPSLASVSSINYISFLYLTDRFEIVMGVQARARQTVAAVSGPNFLQKLGRVLKEKATGDFDRVVKGASKTRERLGVSQAASHACCESRLNPSTAPV